MQIETISYGGWANCYRLQDDDLEVIVTADIGPRIIHYGFVGGDNMLKQYSHQQGLTGGDEYRSYGGHRLWHAPENDPRSYQPDNDPVDHFELDNVHYFVPQVEKETGIQKQLSIQFERGVLTINHTMTNRGLWPIELSPWALTVVRPGGVAIMPLPPHQSHQLQKLPTHSLSLWSYTSLSDPRLHFGDKYILVAQSDRSASPLKIGLHVIPEYVWSVGWLAYVNNGTMFVKSFHPAEDDARYPDLGSQVEVFTNADMLELETLGQLKTILPEESIVHREYWSLHQNIPMPGSDADIGQNILPMIRETHPTVGRRKTGRLRPMG